MSIWGLNRNKTIRKKRSLPARRNRITPSEHALSLEPLESRHLLTVTLSPIVGHDTNSAFDVPAGKDLYVPLTGTDAGQTITYTASSSDPNVSVSVLSGNPTLQLNVSGVDSDGNPFSGTMTIQLFDNLAPETVSVIEQLVSSGFYDGLSFYRIVPNFVIQGGANGSKTANTFDDEFNTDLTFNSPGLLAMANPGTANSNTSEFFITDINQPTASDPQYLNFRHTIFGQLTSGFDLYNKIMNAQGVDSSNSSPTTPVTITSATIINDKQNGVVQISEPEGYTGASTITVTATSTDGSTATQTFNVNAAPASTPSPQQPLLLAPIVDVATKVNTPVSFQMSAEQYYSDDLAFTVTGSDGFRATPANVTVQVTDNGNDTVTVTLTPASDFTGTLHLIAHVDDATNSFYDAQEFTLTVSSTVAISTVTSPINAGNATSTAISGTGNAGDTISVVASDGTNATAPASTTVASDGTWSIVGINVITLADGTITYTATATDTAGGTTQVTTTTTKDVLAPEAAIGSITTPINSSNASSTVISGTAEAGATVTVIATDGTNSTSTFTATVDANGAWTVNSIDVSALADGSITYTATTMDTAGNSGHSSQTVAKDTHGPALEITTVTDPVTIGNATNASVSGTGEIGAKIAVTVTDLATTTIVYNTTVQSDGTWTVAGIDASTLQDGEIFFTVTATDAAGNSVTDSKTSSKGAVVIVLVTDPVNAANDGSVTASGKGETGVTISLVVSDGVHSTSTFTAIIDEDGNWSIEGIDVSALNDGTLTFTATGTDSLGNAAHSEKTATKDTVTPEAEITKVTDPVNAGNAATTSVQGTTEAGATISVVASDGTNTIAAVDGTVAADGTWLVSGINVSTLADGTITYTVTVTDIAGNPTTITKTATKDTIAPAVDIQTATNPIDIANSGSITAGGTGEVGATISVVVTDGTNSTTPVAATVAEDGSWSVSGIDVSGLADGSIIYTVTATDAAGNTAQDTLTAAKSTITVTVVTTPVNAANDTNTSASGTGQVGATVSLVVTDGTNTTTTYSATIGDDGTWSITGIDVSALGDGTLTFTATASDGDGNSAHSSKTTTKDTVAPVITISTVTNPVDASNATSTAISGTGEAGATVSVVVSDGTNSTTTYTATVADDGSWSISNIDVSTLKDGSLTYTATIHDAAANSTASTITTTKGSTATGSLTGVVYIDTNKNGTQDTGEQGLSGIILTLKGVDAQGNAIPTRTTTTSSDGSYSFSGLSAGTYSVTEAQPVALSAGTTASGTLGGTASANIISGIALAGGQNGTGYNFSEQGLATSMLSMRLFMASSQASLPTFYSGYVSEYGVAAPIVTSIVKADADPTNADSVTFTVTFNESVTGVDASDFTVTGGSTATVTSVTGSGTTYTVIVSISGTTGTVGLKLTDDDSIASDSGTALAGTGIGNGDFFGPSYTVSSTGATTVAIASVTSPINATNDNGVIASGTGAAGATISLIASDGTNSTSSYSTTVANDGTWSISGIGVSSLADGTITFTVTATNLAGSTSTDTHTATKDTVAPTVDMADLDGPINADQADNTSVSGTGEPGAAIAVIASDGTHSSTPYSATVQSDGTWSIAGIDVSSLVDGTITFTATATDTAGNTDTASMTATKDTVAPAVQLTDATDPLSIANYKTASASGTGEIGAAISLVVTDGTNTTTTYNATVDEEGNWSITSIDTSMLADGTVTYTATATNAAGNTAQSSLTATKVTVSIASVTAPINAANADNVTISGNGEAGVTITLVVSDGVTTLDTLSTTIGEDGTWSIAGINTTSLADGTLTFTVTATDETQNTATTSTTAAKDTIAPEGAISSVTSPINAANAHSVTASGTGEAGAGVVVIATDGENSSTTYTATVDENGAWSIAGIDVTGLSDGTVTFNMVITDAAGNATQASTLASKDTIAPTVEITTSTDPVTIANHKALELGGSGEPGSTISVVVTDGTQSTSAYNATVAEDGSWAISGIDTSALADGTLTFQVTATDAAGNSAAASQNVAKTTVAISAVGSINAANSDDFTISGTGQAGATLSLVASDGANSTTAYEATVGEDGTWTISGIDLSSLADGTITFTVTATDATGNTAASSRTANKDSVAPELAFVGVTSAINATNTNAVSANGTSEAGATISLVATDGTHSTVVYTITVGENGAWSQTGIDVSELDDGTITFNVMATDASGNSATTSLTATKDTVAPAVSILSLTDSIDIDNQAATQASGSGEVGAAISVVASDGTHSTNAYLVTVGNDGAWSLTGIDVSMLADGTITYTATATDAAGNTAQSSLTGSKHTVAITSVTDPINSLLQSDVTASGTGEAGASISLVVSDGEQTTAAVASTVGQDGTWSISNIDVSGLNDGTLTFTATMTGVSSNTAQSTRIATKDTAEPQLSITNATNPIDDVNSSSVSITGTGEAGNLISVIASDGTNTTITYTATVATDDTWSITGIDVTALADGQITLTAVATDAANNTAQASISVTKGVAAPAVAITSVTNPINSDAASNVSLVGTADPNCTISLVVSDSGGATITTLFEVAGEDGAWGWTGIDVSSLADGTLTFTVTATNGASASAETSITATKSSDASSLAMVDMAFAGEDDWL